MASTTQRFFIATYTDTDDANLKNRVIGLFSNQTELLTGLKTTFKNQFEDLYLMGKRKELPVTNGNIALEFNRDNHLIVYKNNKAAVKVAVFHMNQVNEKLAEII